MSYLYTFPFAAGCLVKGQLKPDFMDLSISKFFETDCIFKIMLTSLACIKDINQPCKLLNLSFTISKLTSWANICFIDDSRTKFSCGSLSLTYQPVRKYAALCTCITIYCNTTNTKVPAEMNLFLAVLPLTVYFYY